MLSPPPAVRGYRSGNSTPKIIISSVGTTPENRRRAVSTTYSAIHKFRKPSMRQIQMPEYPSKDHSLPEEPLACSQSAIPLIGRHVAFSDKAPAARITLQKGRPAA